LASLKVPIIEPIFFTTTASDENKRLDHFLTQALNVSRNQVTQLIKHNAVCIADKPISKPSFKLKAQTSIRVTFIEATPSEACTPHFDVDILYEDEHLMVLNKPVGITVHPAPSVKEATLVDWLKTKDIRLSTLSGEERHGIVHRLDKATSGAIVIAKENETHQALSEQLSTKSMGRFYLAVIEPPLKERSIVIDKPIERARNNRLKMSALQRGKEAKTQFVQLAQTQKQALIACKLFTGRTHQIRAHLESFNRHIIGDPLYGTPSKHAPTKVARMLLHAYQIYFYHPIRKEYLRISAPLEQTFYNYITQTFKEEDIDELLEPSHFEQRTFHSTERM